MRFSTATLSLIVMLAIAHVTWADKKTDEAAIKDVFATFSHSWNQPGMPGFERLFAEDADFVVITGKWLKGRSQIVNYHRELLKGFYNGSQGFVDSVTVRFVNPDIAIAHFASGAHFTQGGKAFTRTGLATATLVKTDGKWLITAFHNTLTSGPGTVVPTTAN